MQILERETSREKNLEKALKEAKIRAKREATKGGEDTKKDASEQEIKQVSCCSNFSASLFRFVRTAVRHERCWRAWATRPQGIREGCPASLNVFQMNLTSLPGLRH